MVHTGPGILFSHFEGLKSPRKKLQVLKGPEICLTQAIKVLEYMLKEMYIDYKEN